MPPPPHKQTNKETKKEHLYKIIFRFWIQILQLELFPLLGVCWCFAVQPRIRCKFYVFPLLIHRHLNEHHGQKVTDLIKTNKKKLLRGKKGGRLSSLSGTCSSEPFPLKAERAGFGVCVQTQIDLLCKALVYRSMPTNRSPCFHTWAFIGMHLHLFLPQREGLTGAVEKTQAPYRKKRG